MMTLAAIGISAVSLLTGFFVGITFRGNPPKRTRKTRKLTTPVEGQSENK